ncbi:MAG: methyl-accepting chemotaxis protein, partial [Pseudomonas sp.]|nr:methyl-accepting chemotaxis protein [Pseudomonas sp.]
MNTLRTLSISQRLWLILIVAMAMLLALGLLMLKQIHDDLNEGKAQKTRHVVQAASGVLDYYHGLETAGSLSRDAAQQQALQVISKMRYDQGDYFWINDLRPFMVMHPTNPKLDGKDLSAIKDPDGVAIFNEMVTLAKTQGSGNLAYRWPKPGADEPVAKTSYVQLFEPWGWVIGSGVYIDDMQAEFQAQVWKASVAGLTIALIMVVLVRLIARSIARPLKEAVQAMANIASGESDLTRSLDTHGRDEVTELARHFNTFTTKLRTVIRHLQATATALEQSSTQIGNDATQAQQRCQQQASQMDQVATAINEVT